MRFTKLICLIVLAVGCEKKDPPAAEPASGAPSASAKKQASKPEPAGAPSASAAPKKVVDDRTIHAFGGTIGADQKIRMYVEKKGAALTGLYLARGSPVTVPLTGKVTADEKFELTESDDKGKPVGTFDGWFRNGLLKGTYTDAKTKKARVFVTEPLTVEKEPFAMTYAGALGGKLRIRTKLDRKGNKVEGVYRYAKSKDNLVLSGTLDAEGELLLKETTKAGKETGRIEAFLLSPELIVGRWYSPDKSKSLALLLEMSNSYPEIVDLGAVKIAPQEEFKDLAKNCTSALMYPVVDGGKGKAPLNAALRKEAGGHSDKESCEGATAEMPYVTEVTYTVQKSKLPYFGVTFNNYWSMGGAHPTWAETCKIADTETGELFALASKMTPEARQKLSALVMKKLQAEHGVEKLSEAGFFEDEIVVSETTNVCLAEKGGLVVEFNPYEITPWVMGAPTVELTREEARPLVPQALAPLVE